MSLISALAVTASVASTSAELSTSRRWRSDDTWFRSPQISLPWAPRPASITPTTSQSPRPKRIFLPMRGLRIAVGDGLADHHLAAAVLEPAAGHQVDAAAHFDAGRLQAAHGDVDAFLSVAPPPG